MLAPAAYASKSCDSCITVHSAASSRLLSRPESLSSPPPTAAAPHLARAAAIEIVKDRGDAAAVPVARKEPDPFPRGPAETGWRPCREPRAVDDEIAAPRRLHDFDHVLLGRQIVPVLIVPPTWIFHLVCEGRRAYRRGQGERRHPLEHFWPPPSVPIPKFASPCRTLSCELRNQRDTSKLVTLVWVLDLKFLCELAANP